MLVISKNISQQKNTLANNPILFPRVPGDNKDDDIPNLHKKLATLKPINCTGIAHRLTQKNRYITPVLLANPTSYSFPINKLSDTKAVVAENSPFVGEKIVLVSAHQSINNARVVFCGSTDLFNDEYESFIFVF